MDKTVREYVEAWLNGNQTAVTLALVELTKKDIIAGLQMAATLGNVIGDHKITRMLEVVRDRYEP